MFPNLNYLSHYLSICNLNEWMTTYIYMLCIYIYIYCIYISVVLIYIHIYMTSLSGFLWARINIVICDLCTDILHLCITGYLYVWILMYRMCVWKSWNSHRWAIMSFQSIICGHLWYLWPVSTGIPNDSHDHDYHDFFSVIPEWMILRSLTIWRHDTQQ